MTIAKMDFLHHKSVIVKLKNGTKKTCTYLKNLDKTIEVFYNDEKLNIDKTEIEEIVVPYTENHAKSY